MNEWAILLWMLAVIIAVEVVGLAIIWAIRGHSWLRLTISNWRLDRAWRAFERRR